MIASVANDLYAGLGVAAALGLAASGFAYASRWPGSQIFGRTLVAPERAGQLALTFDDGPNPKSTPQLLEILAQHDVKATFFMLGQFARQEPMLARYVADAGHLIGNHSWNHPDLSLTSASEVRDQLARTKDTLQQITGNPVRYFRPPYGARRPYVLRAARELGMIPVTWNAMTSDWSEPSPERIAANLMAKIASNQRRGFASNIVLHDGGHRALNTDRNPSLTATGMLLERYKKSLRFVTLDAWEAPGTA